MSVEYRSLTRATKARQGVVDVRAISYNEVDSFGTVWSPGCLNDGFEERLPAACWAHDVSKLVGRAQSWRDEVSGPVLTVRLDNHPDVPLARQVIAQIESGTITDVSVGFERRDWRPPNESERRIWPKAQEMMIRARVSEISFVYEGAVPGAKVLTMRSRAAGRAARDRQLDRELDEALDRIRSRGVFLPSPTSHSQLDVEVDRALDRLRRR